MQWAGIVFFLIFIGCIIGWRSTDSILFIIGGAVSFAIVIVIAQICDDYPADANTSCGPGM